MSKVLQATCEDGMVSADGFAVPGTTILSEGVGPSDGVLILDEDEKTYIPKTSPDLKATILAAQAGLEAASSAIATVALLAGMPEPAIPALVAGIDAAASALGELSEELK